MSPPDPMPEPVQAGDHVDRYEVEAKIGEGATAVVYRLRHRDHGTLHALKVIRVASSRMIRRIAQEGQLQAMLRHPNVVAVTEVVRVGVLPGLVMEYVEGPTLEQLLRSVRPTPGQVDGLARDLMEGVRAAHQRGLVHRDLKPANVLLGLEDRRVVAKVTDFGVAKLVVDRAGLTRTGAVMGTPAYMSPEQFRSAREVDHRTDVFALGAILYELVCGRRALRGEDMISVHMSAARGDFVPLSEMAPEVPSRWADAVTRALQPDREDRPATVDALLDLWTGGQPRLDDAWDPEVLRLVERREPGSEVGSLGSLTAGTQPRALWAVGIGAVVLAGLVALAGLAAVAAVLLA